MGANLVSSSEPRRSLGPWWAVFAAGLFALVGGLSLAGARMAAQSLDRERLALQSDAALVRGVAETSLQDAAANVQNLLESRLPLDTVSAEVLDQAVMLFEQRLERESLSPALRFETCMLLARIAVLRSESGRAAELYQRAKSLLASDSGVPAEEVRFRTAQCDVRLGRVLAARGQWEPAAQATAAGLKTLRLLAAQDASVDRRVLSAELAISEFNWAVIEAARGADPLSPLDRAIGRIAEKVAKSIDAEHVFWRDLLADAHQLQSGLLWRQGATREASAASQASIDVVVGTLEVVQRISAEGRLSFASGKYEDALQQARHNLLEIERDADNGTPATGAEDAAALPHAWRWERLNNARSRVVSHDVLLRGRLPGEFERQEAVLLVWGDDQWSKSALVGAISAVHQRIEVIVLVADSSIQARAERTLRDAGLPADAVTFVSIPANTVWARDFGPLVVERGDGALIVDAVLPRKRRFKDDLVPTRLARWLQANTLSLPIAVDGGAILSNGQGLCLASEALAWVNEQRGLANRQILTRNLQRVTGAERVVYVDPLRDEPTGHLDCFMTFTSPDTLVIGDYGDADPVNAELLDRQAERLARLRMPGGPLRVERIPMPPPVSSNIRGTYTNVIYANGVLLVPTWSGVPAAFQQQAMAVYRRLLPDWEVIGIDCTELGARGGALHCASASLFRLGSLPRHD